MCARSCLGSAIGPRVGDPWPSAGRSRGEAECIFFPAVLGLLPVSIEGLYCAIPAAIPTLVCIHLRYGEECITTLCFTLLRFFGLSSVPLSFCFPSSSSPVKSWLVTPSASPVALRFCSRAWSRLAIRAPRARVWFHPP